MEPTFIVNSGRCGSTMLSTLINRHPDILSISEFFIFLADIGVHVSEVFTTESLDGKQFWELIAGIKPIMNNLLYHNIRIPEVLYPYESPKAKFSSKTGVPAILKTTLPHLTNDHDQLFEELKPFIQKQSIKTVRWHYDNLFIWLKEHFNKKVWVERSGASHLFTKELINIYPKARFVHIFRDGRDTALSMANHFGFRMGGIALRLKTCLGVDPFRSDERSNINQVPKVLLSFLPENFNKKSFLDLKFPLEVVGNSWSQAIQSILDELSKLPPDQVLTLCYEDFCENPVVHLKKLIEFIGVKSDPDWLIENVSLVKPSNNSWKTLPDDKIEILEKSCQPGMNIIEKFYKQS